MASSIQILRSNTAKERPFPGNLLDGQPALNTNSEEPGLFFKASDGSIVKIGPAAITSDGSPPNTGGMGQPGNTIGELWLDKSANPPILKVYDGAQWVDAGSGGGSGQVTLLRWSTLATAGQTVLSGADSSFQQLAYTAGLEEVYINGAFFRRGVDYTATNGLTITLSAPLALNDEITVMAWTPFVIGSQIVDANVDPNAGIQASKLSFTQLGPGAVQRAVEAKLNDTVSVKDFGAITQSEIDSACLEAYLSGSFFLLEPGQTARLKCNPSAGDDFRAMCNWASSQHYIPNNAAFFENKATNAISVEIARGSHEINTSVNVSGNRYLNIVGEQGPIVLQIQSISFIFVSGNTYTATLTFTAPIPAFVEIGWPFGCQMCQGDGSAEAINGAHRVKTISNDRLSLTFDFLAFGQTPVSPTTLDNTTTLSMLANRAFFHPCVLKAKSTGWDGTTTLGFINSMRGGGVTLFGLAIQFDQITSGVQELLYTALNSTLFTHNCVLLGANKRVMRAELSAVMNSYRCQLGGDFTASQAFFSEGNGESFIQLTCAGSFTEDVIRVEGRCSISRSVFAGGVNGSRTSRDHAYNDVIISNCANAYFPNQPGYIKVNTSPGFVSKVKNCGRTYRGIQGGFLYASSITEINTGASDGTQNLLFRNGAWVTEFKSIPDQNFFNWKKLQFVLNTSNAIINAGDYLDYDVAVTGVSPEDFYLIKNSVGLLLFPTLIYQVQYKTTDTITVRINNAGATNVTLNSPQTVHVLAIRTGPPEII